MERLYSKGKPHLARKREKVKRVASVDAMGILMRDLKQIGLWTLISLGVVAILVVLQRAIF